MGAEMTPVDGAVGQITCLYEKYHAEIFGYLVKLVNDRGAAEDLAQETFLNAYRARAGLARVENPRAWLYRIATNLALNRLKRGRRFRWLPWTANHGRSQNDISETTITRTSVDVALATLPPEYRVPLLLSAHFGFTIAELAQAMNVTPGAVKVRLYRAREMFRKAYEREEAG